MQSDGNDPLMLADIGGTHARLAIAGNHTLHDPVKVKVADYESLIDVIADYQTRIGRRIRHLHLATAASWPDADGVYRLANKSLWPIDPAALARAGFTLRGIENDFEASVRALCTLDSADTRLLRAGAADPTASRVMIGPGTGLGLGYLRPDGAVQKTVGGHMPMVAVTPQQQREIERMRDLFGQTPIYECVLSGWGLGRLAEADPLPDTDLFASPERIKLFNEYLGLFAQQAVLFGDGFGGVYLHGGLFDRFYDRGLFECARFESFFIGDPVPVVADRLRQTPVMYVPDPFLTLRGLMHTPSGKKGRQTRGC